MQQMKVDIPTIRAQERQLASSSSSNLTPAPAIAALVNRYDSLVVWRPQDGSRVEARAIPNASERRELEQRIGDLRSALRPAGLAMADRERVGAAVARMFAGYPSQRNSDPRATIATYVLELESLPAWAVERACEAVRLGKVPEVNPDFPPSSVRLNQIAALELDVAKAEKGKIEALLEVVQSPGHRSEAEQAEAEKSATAWLERRDARAKKLAEVNRPSSEKELERRQFTETASREFFLRECRAAGIDPSRGVSPSLLKTLEVRDE